MANRLALKLYADSNPMVKALEHAQRDLDRFTSAAESAGKAMGLRSWLEWLSSRRRLAHWHRLPLPKAGL
jgi:hypothetical protein